jgi:hypothetical protein
VMRWRVASTTAPARPRAAIATDCSSRYLDRAAGSTCGSDCCRISDSYHREVDWAGGCMAGLLDGDEDIVAVRAGPVNSQKWSDPMANRVSRRRRSRRPNSDHFRPKNRHDCPQSPPMHRLVRPNLVNVGMHRPGPSPPGPIAHRLCFQGFASIVGPVMRITILSRNVHISRAPFPFL